MKLVQITAPHFCAGLITHKGRVIETAPILKWMLFKTTREVWEWIKAKGYTIDVRDDPVTHELVPDLSYGWRGSEWWWKWRRAR
jgi:hypothetical protein